MAIDEKVDTYFYIAGLISLLLMIVALIYFSVFGTGILQLVPPCYIHESTGLYCPGCGGTRAVFALFRGHFLVSFLYNPIVVYTAVVGGWFMLSQTIQRMTRGKLKIGMHFRPVYPGIAVALLVINFIVKNFFLLVKGIALMG